MAITKRSIKGSALEHSELDGNFTHLEKEFAVTNSGSSAYVFTGAGTTSDSNPTLYLTRGETYTFAVNASGHPFYINSTSGTGTGNAYNDGVSNNGIDSGDIELTVQMDAPDVLYYNCQYHSSMAGTIHIVKANYSIDDLSDVDTSTSAPTSGQVLKWDGANWTPAADNNSGGGGAGNTFSNFAIGGDTIAADSGTDTLTFIAGSNMTITANTTADTITFASSGSGGGGGASITMADAAPGSPSNGDLWFNTSVLRLYVYYTDGTSNQWVQTNPTGAASATGGSSSIWAEKTSAYTAVAGDNLIIDTTSAVTITLPTTANIGDQIKFIDGTGNAATNNITVGRNGHKIQGAATDLTVSTDRAAFGLVYYNTAQGWLLTER
jgi:hypothetical protein